MSSHKHQNRSIQPAQAVEPFSLVVMILAALFYYILPAFFVVFLQIDAASFDGLLKFILVHLGFYALAVVIIRYYFLDSSGGYRIAVASLTSFTIAFAALTVVGYYVINGFAGLVW